MNTHAPGFWEDVSLRAAVDALPDPALVVDCVIVDEAQDLDESDWTLVEALAEGKPLWCFGDSAQAFWRDRQPPAGLFASQLNLPNNHRCGGPLFEVARGFAGEPVSEEALAKVKENGQLRIVACATDAEVARELEKQVDDLLRQGLKPNEIAVLSLRGQTTPGSLFHQRKLGRHVLVHADDPKVADHIVADTFLRFKGLERPAIIITDLRLLEKGDTAQDVRMHIALTRAQSAVRIVALREAVVAVPLLAGLV
jgi:superfamily I DNA and RNA helicase